MGLGLGLGIQFNSLGGMVSKILTWGKSIPARFWGTTTPEYWGGLDAQAEVHYNRVIADGGVVPAGLGGVNSFFQVVKGVYGTSDINTAISAAYDPHYLGYKLGAGSGTTLGQAAQKMYAPKGIFGGIGTGSAFYDAPNPVVVGNSISTSDAAANQITSNFDIAIRTFYLNSNPTTAHIRKTNSYALFLFTNKTISFQVFLSTVATNYTSTASIPIEGLIWIRVTRDRVSGEIKFFYSDTNTTNLSEVVWTQLGTTIIGSTLNIDSTSGVLSVNNGAVQSSLGRAYRATISNSIDGTPVVDFNANQYTGANTWTSTTGEVWTVNSTGAGLADVTQTTAASQPLLLAHTGENYWWQVPSLPTNNCQTPYQASYNLTSYCDIRIKVDLNINATGNPDYPFLFGWNNFNGLGINNNGTLFFFLNSGGVANTTATISRTYSGWLRVVKNVGVYTYYTSTDGIDWTILQTINASTTNLNVANQPLVVGSSSNDVRSCGMVKYYRCQLYSSTTLLADFNPSLYNPSTSQTEWSSATGEVWTINTGTATSGYKGVLVDRSIVQGDGIDDGLVTGSNIIMNTQFTLYGAFRGYNNEGGSGKSTFGKQNIDGSVCRNIATLLGSWIGASGAAQLNQTADSTKLNLATFKRKVSSNTLQVNNGAVATNTASTAITQSAISVFSVTTYGSSNSLFTTGLFSYIEDDATQKTAMYNYLRSLNNNAF